MQRGSHGSNTAGAGRRRRRAGGAAVAPLARLHGATGQDGTGDRCAPGTGEVRSGPTARIAGPAGDPPIIDGAHGANLPARHRLGGHRRLFRDDGRRRPVCRPAGPPNLRLFPRQPQLQRLAGHRPGAGRRHPCRNAGLAGRQGLPIGLRRHLVPVEEPLHHALLLASRAALPALPPHDDRRSLRGTLRRLDGRGVHGLRAGLLHVQHGGHAQGRGQARQRGLRGSRLGQRGGARHDGHLPAVQLSSRACSSSRSASC